MNITNYLDSWASFYIECSLKAKGRAHINSTGWRRLRAFHFEQYIKNKPEAVPFVITMRFRYPNIYKQIGGANHIYRVCLEKRREMFERR
jgi:hypothetical protein